MKRTLRRPADRQSGRPPCPVVRLPRIAVGRIQNRNSLHQRPRLCKSPYRATGRRLGGRYDMDDRRVGPRMPPRPEMGRVRLGTERSAVGVRRIAGRRGRAASGRDQDRKSTHFRDQTIQTVLTMDDQLYFEQCLLASLERFGFTIDRQLKMARGIAYFATLHPAFSVQIGFELCLDGIRFTVTLHSLSFMKGFPYRHLMRYPPKADIIIPMILRAIFNYLGDELARNFRNQINS